MTNHKSWCNRLSGCGIAECDCGGLTPSELEDIVHDRIRNGCFNPEQLFRAIPGARQEDILGAVWALADSEQVNFTANRRIKSND